MSEANERKVYKFLILIVTLYVTAILAPIVLVHKLITIGGFVTSPCIFLFPLSFIFGDIIAEVYGYKIARQVVWSGIASIFIFSASAQYLSKIPSPAFWPYQSQYELLL